MLGIVRIVIDSELCADEVEAKGKHSFGVHVGEAERSYDLGHSTLLTPLFHSLQQCLRHLYVINKVYPSKSHTFPIPTVVGTMIDDRRHTSHHLTITQGEEIIGFTKLKGSILISAQGGHLIIIEIGHCILVATVEIIMKLNKLFQLATGGYFLDFNC